MPIIISVQPEIAGAHIDLLEDVENPINRWYEPMAETLNLQWSALNLTYDRNVRIDINMYGYWEDADRSHMEYVDRLVRKETKLLLLQCGNRVIYWSDLVSFVLVNHSL